MELLFAIELIKKHYHKEVGRMDESDENNHDQQNFMLETLPRY